MSPGESTREGRLAAFRRPPSRRRLVTLAGVVVGLLLAQFHWLGLVAGGALVSLPQSSVGRGVAAGVGFGVLAWVAFLVGLWSAGVAGLYPAMGQVAAVAAGISVGCGLLGGLARGVV